MSIAELVLDRMSQLPADKQQQVLDFVSTLLESNQSKQPSQSWMGRYDHLHLNITAEEIDEARREMWGTFPREDLP